MKTIPYYVLGNLPTLSLICNKTALGVLIIFILHVRKLRPRVAE